MGLTYDESDCISAQHSTNEALPCLFRRQFDEGSFSKPHSKNISHHIINNDTKLRKYEPVDAFVHIVRDKSGHAKDHNEC